MLALWLAVLVLELSRGTAAAAESSPSPSPPLGTASSSPSAEDFARASIRVWYPASGAVVTVGARSVLDIVFDIPHLNMSAFDGALPTGFSGCLRLGSSGGLLPWSCYETLAALSMTTSKAGPQFLEVALVRRVVPEAQAMLNSYTAHLARLADADEASQLALRERLDVLSYDESIFSSDEAAFCADRLGREGCGRPIPLHCTSPTRFRYFLYQQSTVPTPQAAEVYYALRDSPMRTLEGDPAIGDACIYIAIGDVYASNVQVRARIAAPLARSSPRLHAQSSPTLAQSEDFPDERAPRPSVRTR